MRDNALISTISAMLAKNGCDADTIQVRSWITGGNNRIFMVSAGAAKAVAKWYYTDEADSRDRLHAEWTFINYARNAGITCVPRPIAHDTAKRLALYEFVEGRKLGAREIGRTELEQAASFVRRLNEPSALARARDLPVASEACFSIAEHFTVIDRRLERLKRLAPEGEIDQEASSLVLAIDDAWDRLKIEIEASLKENSLALDDLLEAQDRCISPSDFGFHNVLIRANRELCFLDFEYAGWDDPAKMAADLFYHPAVPIDSAHFEYFVDEILGGSARAERMKWRVRLLRPIFRIKWCCILLNIFVAELVSRMRFGNPNLDVAQCKREQLQKAKMTFALSLN